MRVAEEAEPGHVRHGVGPEGTQCLRGLPVEGSHPADRSFERLRSGQSALEARQDETGPERLRHVERVARLRAVLAPDSVRVDGADDGQAVLRLRVADRMPAGEDRAGAAYLQVGGGEDGGEHLYRQLLR